MNPASERTRVQYLYVTGVVFSGSTLLSFLLNAHPKMVSIGEPWTVRLATSEGGRLGLRLRAPIESFHCSCGELLLHCRFFQELQRRVRQHGTSVTQGSWDGMLLGVSPRVVNDALTQPLPSWRLEQIRDRLLMLSRGYREAVRRVGRHAYYCAKTALEITGKQVFVDAGKSSRRIRLLQQVPELDLRVIHLCRDVRGGVSSLMKNLSYDVVRATYRWRLQNMNAERARQLLPPDRWLRIRYEDLCSDPQGTLDAIADFAFVDRAPIPQDFYMTEHHIIGNRMRLKRPGSGMVLRDDSWQTRLGPRDLAIVTRIAGRANRYFGYAWPQQ